ncbi:MAG: dihydrolipoamide acetyltransferase family protein [Phycisphaerae bacterium]|nr:dihydrolipoamide acetyltransferase family protein [Phycisphaerae bacterium]
MYDVTMPKLSDSMEVGKIIRWLVKEGDEVHAGDVLAEVESDKAMMELECFHDGTVAKIIHGDDSEVPVGQTIGYIAAAGEASAQQAPAEVEKPKQEAEAPPRKPPPKTPTQTKPRVAALPAPQPAGEHAVVSPYARKLADEKGVDYTRLKGTGPGRRIVARDIQKAAVAPKPVPAEQASPPTAEAPPPPTGEAAPPISPSPDEELPPIEVTEDEAEIEDAPFRLRTQVRRVTASKHVIPHFYITRSADVTSLLDKKAKLKEKYGATVTHLVMLACLKTIGQHPEVNRSYDRGRIIKWKDINLGLAVDTEQGLTVPVIAKAQDLALTEIVERTRDVVERARSGKLSSEERRHPTFTITNLGPFDIEHFEPIVNPPSAITLAVPSALPSVIVRGDAIFIGKTMQLSLSCDHRIIDGVTAARFLTDLRAVMESPELLLRGQ